MHDFVLLSVAFVEPQAAWTEQVTPPFAVFLTVKQWYPFAALDPAYIPDKPATQPASLFARLKELISTAVKAQPVHSYPYVKDGFEGLPHSDTGVE
mmetsp:Transcript_78580/g.136342  ORF Transcript_78580/g.136342 Transcript_78580/m.136342 type:complete len:96 (-) Transcript_78580:139-426(-)